MSVFVLSRGSKVEPPFGVPDQDIIRTRAEAMAVDAMSQECSTEAPDPEGFGDAGLGITPP